MQNAKNLMLNRLFKLLSNTPNPPEATSTPQHSLPLDSSLISRNAVKVITALQNEGFSAYLVGGGIRDLLLGGKPKDFDVATDATPEEIKKHFRSATIIGRRFRIVHVRFGREIIEVTTFRAAHHAAKSAREAERSASGMLLRDNVYGDIESDALRRDFTVNALYFDPNSEEVLDFTGGLLDLEQRRLKMIGDPSERYREDPVRMLRAVRFSAKLGFHMEAQTAHWIDEHASLLSDIPPARLFEEVLKLLLNGSATATFELLRQTGLLQYLFPATDYCLQNGNEFDIEFVNRVLVNTDKRLRQNKRVTPAFIYAAFLWLPLQAAMRPLIEDEQMPPVQAMQQAANAVIGQQLGATAIPRRFLIPMREIWSLQLRLPRREGGKAFKILEHPRFRAAYDFLLLREEAGEALDGLGLWWTRFQDLETEQQETMVAELGGRAKKRRRPRKRRRKTTPSEAPPDGNGQRHD